MLDGGGKFGTKPSEHRSPRKLGAGGDVGFANLAIFVNEATRRMGCAASGKKPSDTIYTAAGFQELGKANALAAAVAAACV